MGRAVRSLRLTFYVAGFGDLHDEEPGREVSWGEVGLVEAPGTRPFGLGFGGGRLRPPPGPIGHSVSATFTYL